MDETTARDYGDDADAPDNVVSLGHPTHELAAPEPIVVPTARQPLILGRHRSIVVTALLFALGAAVAYLLFRAVEQLRGVLVMLALALLIALALEPLVALLERRHIPRWAAALVTWAATVALLLAPVVLAVQAGSTQLPKLLDNVPALIEKAEKNLGSVGTRLHQLTSSGGTPAQISPDKVLTYLFAGGQVLFRTVESIIVVGMLSLFLLITLPRLRAGTYALVPRTRRRRVQEVTDDLLGQVSRFMLANVITSVLAGVATWAWALGFGIPYAVLLGALVAVLDLVPTVGSTIGGIVVSLVALTVGLGTAIATAIFYIGFRLTEDYLIQPKALRYSVELPGVVTVPAVLAGGAVLGIPGALFAVPAALIVRALVRDLALPALDRR